jgi:hypothetical protein
LFAIILLPWCRVLQVSPFFLDEREVVSSSIRGTDELHFTRHLFVDEAAQFMCTQICGIRSSESRKTSVPRSVVLDPASQDKRAEVILVGDHRPLFRGLND